MPTATEFFGTIVNNLGPLTTTYTAPPSCTATSNTDHILFVNAKSPYWNYLMSSSCRAKPFGDCHPSGKERDLAATQTTIVGKQIIHYFSPGIACPNGWETAATMKHGTKSGEIDVSGDLTRSQTQSTDGLQDDPRAPPLHPTDFWRNILDKSETLVYCCPSGYGGDIYGYCISTIPTTLTKSNAPDLEYCQVYATDDDFAVIITSLDGVTQTNEVGWLSFEPMTGDLITSRITLDTNYIDDLAFATWVPAVTLIHEETATGSADKGGSDDENAATGVSRGGVVSVLGVALGLLAGAGMLMAW